VCAATNMCVRCYQYVCALLKTAECVSLAASHIYAITFAYTHTHMHPHTHIHTHMRTHIHTHIHTHMLRSWSGTWQTPPPSSCLEIAGAVRAPNLHQSYKVSLKYGHCCLCVKCGHCCLCVKCGHCCLCVKCGHCCLCVCDVRPLLFICV